MKIRDFTVILIVVILISMVFFAACDTQKQEKPTPKRLSAEELTLDWIDTDVTANQLEKNQEYREKEISDNSMYVTYVMDNFLLTFTTDGERWGSASDRLILVEIFEDNDGKFSGPRGIHVGDEFKAVMEKFPQEQKWEDNPEGIFYGNSSLSDKPEYEKGSITTLPSGLIDFITLVPKGHPPYMKIHFKENHVDRIIIYYMLF